MAHFSVKKLAHFPVNDFAHFNGPSLRREIPRWAMSLPLLFSLGGLSRSGRQLLERHSGRAGGGQADRCHQAVGAAEIHIRPQQRYMIG